MGNVYTPTPDVVRNVPAQAVEVPPDQVQVFARSAGDIVLPAVTGESTFLSLPIAAGAMGTNGGFRIFYRAKYTINAANTGSRAFRLYLGGVQFHVQNCTNTNPNIAGLVYVFNNGSNVAQVSSISFTGGVGPVNSNEGIETIDTTGALTLEMRGNQLLTTDAMTLEGYLIEYIPGV